MRYNHDYTSHHNAFAIPGIASAWKNARAKRASPMSMTYTLTAIHRRPQIVAVSIQSFAALRRIIKNATTRSQTLIAISAIAHTPNE